MMTRKEIEELAVWTAKSIQDTLAMDGRKLDDAGTDIIREYVSADLRNWVRGEKVTVATSARLVMEIMSRRRLETKTEAEVYNALFVLCTKFPDFVEEQSREREAEAAMFAKMMPAVKV